MIAVIIGTVLALTSFSNLSIGTDEEVRVVFNGRVSWSDQTPEVYACVTVYDHTMDPFDSMYIYNSGEGYLSDVMDSGDAEAGDPWQVHCVLLIPGQSNPLLIESGIYWDEDFVYNPGESRWEHTKVFNFI